MKQQIIIGALCTFFTYAYALTMINSSDQSIIVNIAKVDSAIGSSLSEMDFILKPTKQLPGFTFPLRIQPHTVGFPHYIRESQPNTLFTFEVHFENNPSKSFPCQGERLSFNQPDNISYEEPTLIIAESNGNLVCIGKTNAQTELGDIISRNKQTSINILYSKTQRIRTTTQDKLLENKERKTCKCCGATERTYFYFAMDRHSKCGKCLNSYYCSTECQKKDWPSHKKTCRKAS